MLVLGAILEFKLHGKPKLGANSVLRTTFSYLNTLKVLFWDYELIHIASDPRR